jgi:5-methylcytosine-specific restriction protein A
MKRQPNWGNGRGGRPWRRTVERIKLRDKYTCQVCGRVTLDGEVDHKVPQSKGGTDEDLNLQYLCTSPCHRDKTIREAGGRPVQGTDVNGWPL